MIVTESCTIPAQRREGEYSPSKVLVLLHDGSDVQPRSTKGGGIFPLQELLSVQHAAAVERSTKGGGIFPLQALLIGGRVHALAPLNEGRGNIPPPRAAAQRKTRLVDARSTKGGGIFPLQAAGLIDSHDAALRAAQRREGEYSPSKTVTVAEESSASAPLNEGRGNIPPPRGRCRRSNRAPRHALNEGRGNIPPPSRHGPAPPAHRRTTLNEGRGNIPPPRSR